MHAGLKVGVIEQLETKAEAQKAGAKNGMVRRQLVNVSAPATRFEPAQDGAVHLLALHASGFSGADLLRSATSCGDEASSDACLLSMILADGDALELNSTAEP